MKIAFISHTPWPSEFVVGSHHLAKAMAANGFEVTYISRRRLPAQRFIGGGLVQLRRSRIRKNLEQICLESVLPIGRFSVLNEDPVFALAAGRLKAAVSAERFDIIFVDDPRLCGVVKCLRYNKLIYRPTDVYRYMGVRQWRTQESFILGVAAGLIATSEPVLEHLRQEFQTTLPSMVVNNGVDFSHFRNLIQHEPHLLSAIPRPRCVYVGSVDRRLDLELLGAAADELPGHSFVIFGAGAREASIPKKGNVHYFGSLPYSEVPAVLQHCDIGLLPFSEDQGNDGRSPMKLFEYLLSGLPVISKRTRSLSHYADRAVYTYDSAEEFVALLKDLPAHERRQAAIDEKYDWPNIAARVLAFASDVK